MLDLDGQFLSLMKLLKCSLSSAVAFPRGSRGISTPADRAPVSPPVSPPPCVQLTCPGSCHGSRVFYWNILDPGGHLASRAFDLCLTNLKSICFIDIWKEDIKIECLFNLQLLFQKSIVIVGPIQTVGFSEHNSKYTYGWEKLNQL